MSGLETPDTIDLRKRAGTDTPDTQYSNRELYHVIQEKKTGKGDGALFGSDKTYVLPGKGDVELSINPDQLENQLEADQLKDAYDAEKAGREGGEFNDDKDNDPRNKRKRRTDTSMAAKRHKDFKF